MNKYIYDRVINESKYIIDTGSTVREVAEVFGVSDGAEQRAQRDGQYHRGADPDLLRTKESRLCCTLAKCCKTATRF